MRLNKAQRRILEGLLAGHAYVSASEIPELQELRRLGLVETWSTVGGFRAWRITSKGTTACFKTRFQGAAISDGKV